MIYFFSENSFVISEEVQLINWINKVVSFHNGKVEEVNFIFCDDDYLLKINQDYLQHDYYTDIITFDNSVGKELMGDIYISTDRVLDNAKEFNISFDDEFRRVVIHGVLHMLGFKDKSERDQELMTKMEDEALLLFTP